MVFVSVLLSLPEIKHFGEKLSLKQNAKISVQFPQCRMKETLTGFCGQRSMENSRLNKILL